MVSDARGPWLGLPTTVYFFTFDESPRPVSRAHPAL